MKILYIGCVESSNALLLELIRHNANIVGVITKSCSKVNSDFYDLSNICIQNEVDYIYTDNINDNAAVDYIIRKEPDIIYCFGWSQLLSKQIINLPPKGIIGFHPAELPYNRGRHPIIWALALGLEKTASTFFSINEGADEGNIISQEFIKIDIADNARTLYDKIISVAKKQVISITNDMDKGTAKLLPQNNVNSNYWRKRNVKDGEIDWRMSARSIYNLVRALTNPYPGAHFIHNNKLYKVWASEIIDNDRLKNIEPGKIIEVYSDTSFLVKTGEGLIKINDCDLIKLKKGDYLF